MKKKLGNGHDANNNKGNDNNNENTLLLPLSLPPQIPAIMIMQKRIRSHEQIYKMKYSYRQKTRYT